MENLVGYAKRDLVVLQATFTDLHAANLAAPEAVRGGQRGAAFGDRRGSGRAVGRRGRALHLVGRSPSPAVAVAPRDGGGPASRHGPAVPDLVGELTAGDLADLGDVMMLAEAVLVVLELHAPEVGQPGPQVCGHDGALWPCTTTRAIAAILSRHFTGGQPA